MMMMEAILEKSVKVPSLENIEPQTFRRKYYNKAPVVLKKSAESWKPCSLWNPDYLKTALEGSYDYLEVLESLDNKHFIDNSEFTTRKKIAPGRFIDYIFNEGDVSVCAEGEIGSTQGNYVEQRTSHDRIYLRTNSMPCSLFNDISTASQIHDLRDKIYPPNDLGVESVDEFSRTVFRQNTMQLWIGTRGNVTPLHYDRNHGLLLQIIGTKRVLLYSHEDTSFLYPFPSYSSKSHLSRVQLRSVNDESELLASFPKLSRAQPYSCVISRGDILYTPPFWWHDVTSLDNCVSVTLPWDLHPSDEIPSCMLR